jgi:hypothetical protein
MHWNTIPNEERLRLWKTLRADIVEPSLDDKLELVAKFCSHIPYGSRTLDYYDPQSWPTPWEILFYGSFCTSSISLLIYYTLTMQPYPTKVDLYLVEDTDGIYLLPVIDNQLVLNYELGQVNRYSDIAQSLTVLKIYTSEQIKTIS